MVIKKESTVQPSQPLYAWLCHSNYSFLQASSSPNELVTTAYEKKYDGLGVVDFDGVYGLAQTYKAQKDFSETPFRTF